MAFDTTWNIDKYKVEHESEEHWELRKKFMETHKDKFPQEKLVCLARVFFNVEFLGCRYPEKTMQLVAELSKGVADEHREKNKTKLKRTFVQASDAAGSKIKGTPNSAEHPKKILKTSEGTLKNVCSLHDSFVTPESPEEAGPFPGFIIYEHYNANPNALNCPFTILMHSAQRNGYEMKAECLRADSPGTGQCCKIFFNHKLLVQSFGDTQKEARAKAAREGLKLLKKTYYTIQAKRPFFSESPSISKNETQPMKGNEMPLPQDNIGSKIMQKMGWTGSGLGKAKQGIQEPVKAAPKILQRAGFGHLNQKGLSSKFRQVMKDFVAGDSESDLVFDADFTNDERKILHQMAHSLRLKTRSYGKGEKRHLVVFKPAPDLRTILNALLECGGENQKYKIIPPGIEDECSSPLGIEDESYSQRPEFIKNSVTISTEPPLEISKKAFSSSAPLNFQDDNGNNPPNLLVQEKVADEVPITNETNNKSQFTSELVQTKRNISNTFEAVQLSKSQSSQPNSGFSGTWIVSNSSVKVDVENVVDNVDTNIINVKYNKKYIKCEETVVLDDSETAEVNKCLKGFETGLLGAIDRYNAMVNKFFDNGGSLTQKDMRRYSFWRDRINKKCGLLKTNLFGLPLKNITPLQFLIDKNEVSNLPRSTPWEDWKNKNLNPNMPQRKLNNSFKAQRKLQAKQKGLEILQDTPELQENLLKHLVEAEKDATIKGNTKEARKLRKQLDLKIQRLGKEALSET